MPSPPRVFISHTTQDERDFALAHNLAVGLQERGAEVWVAPDNIPAGAKWEQEIIGGILKECSHFLVILSAASTSAEWVLKEIELARQRYNQDNAFSILPLRVGLINEFSFREFLSQFQELKYHRDYPEQLDEVAAALDLPLAIWPQYLQGLLKELEYLNLFPISIENLSIDTLTPIRLFKHKNAEKSRMASDSFTLQEVLNDQVMSLVVGPGGSGKTTALRWLAFKMAKQCLETSAIVNGPQGYEYAHSIPVLVALSRYEGSLIDLIRNTLEVRGIKSSDKTLADLLKQNKIFLLFDGLDEVSDKRRFIADLEDLVILAPTIRIVLTSRDDQALITRPLLKFSRYEVAPLGDSQVMEIFRAHLGAGRAESLFHTIENQHLLEAFRHPLMAWLISFAYRDSVAEPLPLARGVLYQTVIDRNFLRVWEAKHYSDLADYQVTQKISCLARIGYEMVLQNISSLEEEMVEKFCGQEIMHGDLVHSEPIAKLLGHLYSTGIVQNTAGNVVFWHLSFRDYFAAVWLKNHFDLHKRSDLLKILKLSWQQRWHDTFIILIGLLDDSQARTLLQWMLRLARASLLALAWRSKGWASNQLFLTLKCLCNTRQAHNELKDSFIELITGENFYLHATSVPIGQLLFFSGDEMIYLHFYTLIGQLGTKRSFDFLQQGKGFGRRSKICGLAQFWDINVLFEELKESSDEDPIGDELVAHFLLMFPPDTLLSELRKFFEENEPASKRRLLSGINYNIRHERTAEGRHKKLGKDDKWFHLFMNLALHDEDSEVRDNALRICTAFGEHEAWLPDICERILLKAIKEEDSIVRGRALEYLVYVESSRSLDILTAALDKEEGGQLLTPYVR